MKVLALLLAAIAGAHAQCDNAAGPDGVAAHGYNYHAGTNGRGHPHRVGDGRVSDGFRFLMDGSSTYPYTTAGCAAGCNNGVLGFACVTFMSYPGNNCYLFAEGAAGGWHNSHDGGWMTFDRCSSSSCAAPDGMTGFEYYADDPYGYPNGYTYVGLGANGYSVNRAGCRAACEADALGFDCVVFMSHPGDNCYLFAEGVATGWNDQGHDSADGGWTTYRKCSGGCTDADATPQNADATPQTGYNYRNPDAPWGGPHGGGQTRMLLSSNGFSQDFAGCRASCDAAGDTCATFMYIHSDNCYKWAEGSQATWGAGGVGDWIAFDKCTGSSPPPPPCAAGTSGSPGSCADCAAGQYQNSGGQGSCITW